MRQTAASAGKHRRPGFAQRIAPSMDTHRPVDRSWITRRTQFRIPLDLENLGQANLTA